MPRSTTTISTPRYFALSNGVQKTHFVRMNYIVLSALANSRNPFCLQLRVRSTKQKHPLKIQRLVIFRLKIHALREFYLKIHISCLSKRTSCVKPPPLRRGFGGGSSLRDLPASPANPLGFSWQSKNSTKTPEFLSKFKRHSKNPSENS